MLPALMSKELVDRLAVETETTVEEVESRKDTLFAKLSACQAEKCIQLVEDKLSRLCTSTTFSTSGSSYFNVHSLPCIICIMLHVFLLCTVTRLCDGRVES